MSQRIIDALRLDTAERALRDVGRTYATTGRIPYDALRAMARHVRMAHDAIEREPFAARIVKMLQTRDNPGKGDAPQ